MSVTTDQPTDQPVAAPTTDGSSVDGADVASRSKDALREHVRDRYAAAASAVLTRAGGGCCGSGATADDATGETSDADSASSGGGCCGSEADGAGSCSTGAASDHVFGKDLYDAVSVAELPDTAVLASMGCGNPTAVAELKEGETVLDLGSGGGIDVLLSARRVGASGRAIGVDMTDEMLELARANAAEAGVENVEFLRGTIEALPLEDASIDVVISNCVINLSTDKPAVFAEIGRVLRPGGRVGVSDVVAEDRLTPDERAERGDYAGCIAGALSISEYRDQLAAAGLEDVEVELTHEVADGLHGAIVRARRPVG